MEVARPSASAGRIIQKRSASAYDAKVGQDYYEYRTYYVFTHGQIGFTNQYVEVIGDRFVEHEERFQFVLSNCSGCTTENRSFVYWIMNGD